MCTKAFHDTKDFSVSQMVDIFTYSHANITIIWNGGFFSSCLGFLLLCHRVAIAIHRKYLILESKPLSVFNLRLSVSEVMLWCIYHREEFPTQSSNLRGNLLSLPSEVRLQKRKMLSFHIRAWFLIVRAAHRSQYLYLYLDYGPLLLCVGIQGCSRDSTFFVIPLNHTVLHLFHATTVFVIYKGYNINTNKWAERKMGIEQKKWIWSLVVPINWFVNRFVIRNYLFEQDRFTVFGREPLSVKTFVRH